MLELLLLSSKHFDCYFLCFNALIGLSCYLIIMTKFLRSICFNALTGLSCYNNAVPEEMVTRMFQCPHGLELLLGRRLQENTLFGCFNALTGLSCYEYDSSIFTDIYMFQCPHGLELLPYVPASTAKSCIWFQCPHGLELLRPSRVRHATDLGVSMPSRA